MSTLHREKTKNSDLIKVWFKLKKSDWHTHLYESMWAEFDWNNTFQLKNIPFYVYWISYDDVFIAELNSDKIFEFKSIIEKKWHSTYRIIISNITKEKILNIWLKYIEQLHCTYECASKKFYWIDIPLEANINKVYKILEKWEEEWIWSFEESDYFKRL